LSVDDIAAGIAAGQFEAFLQPKVLLADGRLAGGEALARWRHPQLGFVPPSAFIETIEHSALVEPFSLAIVESAAWAVRWLHESGLPGHIAVNASPAWLDQPAMADRLSQAVGRLGLPVGRLTIEVTESVANTNLAAALENLARLRLRGFTLSVDDFGTGFSSLGRLVSSPFRELKFDRSFITGIEPGTPRWMVVESVIALARKLGLRTVAEGIETEAEWQLLKDAGCEYAQGYYIAKPMARDDFLAWARARQPELSRASALSG
jgi:EAL domain-containing protein (putative c-di-GMP-specific phosphodiesterase class I)